MSRSGSDREFNREVIEIEMWVDRDKIYLPSWKTCHIRTKYSCKLENEQSRRKFLVFVWYANFDVVLSEHTMLHCLEGSAYGWYEDRQHVYLMY